MADGSLTAKRQEIALLRRLEERILWLAAWTIHNANHLRESRDGLKVGGHQASSASLTTIMTALYMAALKPQDRVKAFLKSLPATLGEHSPARVGKHLHKLKRQHFQRRHLNDVLVGEIYAVCRNDEARLFLDAVKEIR